MGTPTGPELGDAALRWRDYTQGRVYWSPETGVHEVHGAILAKYRELGMHGGYGVPTSDKRVGADGRGRYSTFTGGRAIYWTPGTGAWEVYGAIRARWGQLGYERSYLGYPTSGEFAVPGGRQSNFQRGCIVWDAATGRTTDRRY